MMTPVHENGLARQPWLTDFIQSRGFQRTGVDFFSNGRASIRFEGHQLIATPANEGRCWRSDLSNADAGTVRFILSQLLSTPGFLSNEELSLRAARERGAHEALGQIGRSIQECPDSPSGQQLRRFVWSLFNGHHVLNLWRMKQDLDSNLSTAVTEAFNGWMQGLVSEELLRRVLVDSGEMDRWNEVNLSRPDRDRLAEAMNAVVECLRSVPPSTHATRVARANELLQQAMESLWVAETK